MNEERQRLEAQRLGREDWRLWGPYLAERAWGTVREDYSADARAWRYFPHDHARSRAYRWSEDGLGGISDLYQTLCFAVALWNGEDPILKERAFGLNGNEGNHGEDVKEIYFYPDATPSHSRLRYLYKYPQRPFPYEELVAENARRSRIEPTFGLIDTGVFDDNRYFDVDIVYSKAAPDRIHIRITVTNRGPEAANLDVLPSLWFRNVWSWGDEIAKPALAAATAPEGAAWTVQADHDGLGRYFLYGRSQADLLFTENETNRQRLFDLPSRAPFVKDAFHRYLIEGDAQAVNPAKTGTKCAALTRLQVGAGQSAEIDLVLSAQALDDPFAEGDAVHSARLADADRFYRDLAPEADEEDRRILRQALAGMVWCKQFFHFDVERWIKGDPDVPVPPERLGKLKNRDWKALKAADIISMPDSWEYPWFAAWDLAFHCGALALIDVDFAKEQIELMLRETYLHPNGQIPAYEWNFSDVNPPVHAMGALKVFRAERVQRGQGDIAFLQRVFHKLLLNYAWWLNRKDADGHNVFEGGFLGLDNISVFDRSEPLPEGFSLKQADATGWMAMFALNMTVMALEIATVNASYEDMAIQAFKQFLAIADAIDGNPQGAPSLWDEEAGFFKDLITYPDGSPHRIDVYSMVGLIPLFAAEVIDERLLATAPRFSEILHESREGMFQGHKVCACPEIVNDRGERLLALVDHYKLPRILTRLLSEDEFLSPYGVRSVSRIHEADRDLGMIPGIGHALIEYVPGESNSPMFGGNSNWRGPIWLPVNYALVQAIEKYHRFLGDNFRITLPGQDGTRLNLREIATLIATRNRSLFYPDADGGRPVYADRPVFREDPHWRDFLLFHEYFHAETGQGLGAAHQTGWTGLCANLVLRRYRKDIPPYWRGNDAGPGDPA